jgi:outer membrane immunogenic protein
MAFATPALAQDDAAQPEFDGLYVGGSVGANLFTDDEDARILFDRNLDGTFGDTVTTTAGANAFSPGFCGGGVTGATPPLEGCDAQEGALEFSGRVGFDRQMGTLVIGGIAEVGTSDYRSAVSAFSTTPASYTFTREIEYLANVRARIGFTPEPVSLIYATAGVGYVSMDNSFATTNTVNAVTSDFDEDSIGFVVGGGVEHKLSSNISLGIEYLFQQYQDESTVRLGARPTTPATNPFLLGNPNGTDFARSDETFDMHSVRAVLNFRF